MTDDLQDIKADHVVDARAKLCPVPVLAASKAAKDVPPGGVMEIQATDPAAASDVPAWARRSGHEFLGMLQAPGYLRLFVRMREG
jgi:tRNA 2-thiouridine synthesizing protein A